MYVVHRLETTCVTGCFNTMFVAKCFKLNAQSSQLRNVLFSQTCVWAEGNCEEFSSFAISCSMMSGDNTSFSNRCQGERMHEETMANHVSGFSHMLDHARQLRHFVYIISLAYDWSIWITTLSNVPYLERAFPELYFGPACFAVACIVAMDKLAKFEVNLGDYRLLSKFLHSWNYNCLAEEWLFVLFKYNLFQWTF